MAGWSAPTKGVKTYAQLPEGARRYVARLEEVSGVPVGIISTGSDRLETIIRENSAAARWVGYRRGFAAWARSQVGKGPTKKEAREGSLVPLVLFGEGGERFGIGDDEVDAGAILRRGVFGISNAAHAIDPLQRMASARRRRRAAPADSA